MKILYYDCFAGISGDMNLAAMLDLGVPLDILTNELKKLELEGYTIKVEDSLKMGISGKQVNVHLMHSHPHHHHNHSDEKHHHHRTYKDIKSIILNSELSDSIKKLSISIFERIAIAEAKIHSKTIDDVHFHEVGAVDSIVDIVGAAICFDYLNPDKVLCSTIELGGGFVNCAHGRFPVPAPATVEILKEIPVKKGVVPFETTTPTGAAILATLVNEFTDTPVFSIKKTAYGIGHRNLEIPNVLRAHIAENSEDAKSSATKILECNIDDMPAEYFEHIIDRLLISGAQDVYLTPIIMKKSRPATKLSVLCTQDKENILRQIIYTESTTLGIRSYFIDKHELKRIKKTVSSNYGNIEVKYAYIEDDIIKMKPEYEQCKKASLTYNIPLKDVISEVMEQAKKIKNE